MAQAIFKSWFVDFEPVKAKIAARQSLTPALSRGEREEMVLRAAMSAISGKADAELDALEARPSPPGEGPGVREIPAAPTTPSPPPPHYSRTRWKNRSWGRFRRAGMYSRCQNAST